MLGQVLGYGILVGFIHFVALGVLYGNPWCDGIWQQAQTQEPGVRRWPDKKKYLLTQFLGTQIEVFIVTVGYLWLRPLVPAEGLFGLLLLGAFFSALRIYPRTWNMWIQSTYPTSLLVMESVNGVLSTLVMFTALHFIVG